MCPCGKNVVVTMSPIYIYSHTRTQRDYFGAHTYERVDAPGKFVHTNWTGRGGDVSSTVYNK